MKYTKLTNEAFNLYSEFCCSGFSDERAFDLTKFCINVFPIFREMIEEEGLYV